MIETGFLLRNMKEGESLSIGEDVFLTIKRVTGGSIRVGVKAPKDKKIRFEDKNHDMLEGLQLKA